MDLVVNEWLPEYFLPGAKKEEKAQLYQFIQRFAVRGDRLVVAAGSRFLKKIDVYAKLYSKNQEVYPQIKAFITGVLERPQRATIITISDPLPQQTYAVLHEPGTNYHSDEYLFHAAMRTDSKRIITTDERLRDAMANDAIFKVILLSDFLKDY